MRILLAISLFLLLSACGEEEATQVRVENGWIAEIPPVIKVTLALMTLLNDSEQPKYLVGATSAKAEYIEIHRSIVVDDLARMVRQTEVEIPPRGSIGRFRGRVVYDPPLGVVVDTRSGRLTGAAVAGLVVGAMGVFIFGLYLRRWLLERRAHAGETGHPGARAGA